MALEKGEVGTLITIFGFAPPARAHGVPGKESGHQTHIGGSIPQLAKLFLHSF